MAEILQIFLFMDRPSDVPWSRRRSQRSFISPGYPLSRPLWTSMAFTPPSQGRTPPRTPERRMLELSSILLLSFTTITVTFPCLFLLFALGWILHYYILLYHTLHTLPVPLFTTLLLLRWGLDSPTTLPDLSAILPAFYWYSTPALHPFSWPAYELCTFLRRRCCILGRLCIYICVSRAKWLISGGSDSPCILYAYLTNKRTSALLSL